MPEKIPAVSVLVTCYNYGRFLADALDSILAQTFQDWECLIVDDGSTDDSREVAERFVAADPRFRLIATSHRGISAARNAGLAQVRGRYVQLLDADDAIAPEKLQLQSQYLDANPEAGLVFGDTEYFSGDISARSRTRTDISVPDHSRRADACGAALLPVFIRENFLVISGPLYRRTLAEKVGEFDEELRSYEDWQYWFRIALAGGCFHYRPTPGTETWIRYGHSSLMRNHMQMNRAGIQLRHYFRQYLHGSLARYNRIRLLRLRASQMVLRIKRIWKG